MSVLTLCDKVALNFCFLSVLFCLFVVVVIFFFQFYHSTDKLEFSLLIPPFFLTFGLFEKANSSGENCNVML